MSTPETTRGKGLFIAGVVVLALFSTVHMIPFCADLFSTPTEPVEIEMKRAMEAVKVDMGPFHTHYGKLWLMLSGAYSALVYFVVALNYVALKPMMAAGRLKQLAMVNALFSGILLATAVAVTFPPPALFLLVATVVFSLAMIKAAKVPPREMAG